MTTNIHPQNTMDGELTLESKTDYDDIVQSIRRLKNAEADVCLDRMAAELRSKLEGSPEEMLPQMQTMPAYAGLAFRGQLKFSSLQAQRIIAQSKASPETGLDHARSIKAVQIHPDAAPAWKKLSAADAQTAWIALQINAMGDPSEQRFAEPT